MRGWALVEMRGLGLGRCRRCTMYALLNELLITTIDMLVSNIIYIHKKKYQTSAYTSVLSSVKAMAENKWIYHWSYQQQTPKKVRHHSKLDYT